MEEHQSTRKLVIGVMGAGEGAIPADVAHARQLGELIAREGWVLLTGGRNVGVMKAANQGAKQVEGGLTIGILPSATSAICPEVDVAIITDLHNARNNINVLSSNVVIACGTGGPGTVSEVALALKAGKPVILLGASPATNAFFQALGGDAVLVVETPEEAIAAIKHLLQSG
ncbi:MAG: LOG family protein [Candidatus Tectomicrobia bacterium]|uniref:LOG family protein n=1 Tax=Tectimicrobiota bacterium TaxID=2528274 RepID=A0A932FVW3_UNCTE|nr:LOG family protein [Candidatus Tectomicrobia bacterium]